MLTLLRAILKELRAIRLCLSGNTWVEIDLSEMDRAAAEERRIEILMRAL